MLDMWCKLMTFQYNPCNEAFFVAICWWCIIFGFSFSLIMAYELTH